MQKQRGMSFIGLVLMIAGIVFVAVIGMKLAPAYIEYFAVKKAIVRISNEPNFSDLSKGEIAAAFDKSASIDDINEVKGKDLQLSKNDNGKSVVSVEYEKVVPLFGNVSALLEFSATTEPKKLSLQ